MLKKWSGGIYKFSLFGWTYMKFLHFAIFWKKKRTMYRAEFACNIFDILSLYSMGFLTKFRQKPYILPFFNKKKSQCSPDKSSVTPLKKNKQKTNFAKKIRFVTRLAKFRWNHEGIER